MWYRFHLKSFDPRYRPFLIAITRAQHCRDQAWSERLLDESEPCLLCIHCQDEKQVRFFKNQIERAIPFWWLHENPDAVEQSDWTPQSWPRLPRFHRCCKIEVRRVRTGLCPHTLKPIAD
jgi:hypothetical protein